MSDQPSPADLSASPTLSDAIAARIRAYRKRLGLSREELADRCGLLGRADLTYGAIVNIEAGRPNPKTGVRRREITIDELAILEQALGVRLMDPIPPCGTCHDLPRPAASWLHVPHLRS